MALDSSAAMWLTAWSMKVIPVRVLDDLSSGKLDNIQGHISSGKVEFVKGDIRDASLVTKSLDGVNVVIHMAALDQCSSFG